MRREPVEQDPLALAKALAVKAGKTCLALFGRVEARVKRDRSIVTEADVTAQRLIERGIRKAFPDHHILGEEETDEGARRDFRRIGRGEFLWVVDPLDGTDGYQAGLPSWGTAIALLAGDRPVLGVFYAPILDELYWATDRGPAHLGDREIRVQGGRFNAECFLTVHSVFHRTLRTTYPAKVRSLGSTLVHQCCVARGAACGAVLNGHLWDLAAGMLIVERAGGVTRYLDGSPVRLRPLMDGSALTQDALAAPVRMWKPLRASIVPVAG